MKVVSLIPFDSCTKVSIIFFAGNFAEQTSQTYLPRVQANRKIALSVSAPTIFIELSNMWILDYNVYNLHYLKAFVRESFRYYNVYNLHYLKACVRESFRYYNVYNLHYLMVCVKESFKYNNVYNLHYLKACVRESFRYYNVYNLHYLKASRYYEGIIMSIIYNI